MYSAPSIGPLVIENLKKNQGNGVKMNMKMVMHSEYDPKHYKYSLISNGGKPDPLIPAMFGFPLLCVRAQLIYLVMQKRIDFLLFRGEKKSGKE